MLLVAGCAAEQELKLWRHGLIERMGDAGFSMMVGRNGFAERQGLKVEIVPFKNGATAHKPLLAGEIDASRLDGSRAYRAEPEIAEMIVVGGGDG